MRKIKVLAIFGTRPEVIKMAPIVHELQNREVDFDLRVIITGQHYELCQPYLKLFSIVPDHDLSIMEENQTLNSIVRNILLKLPQYLELINPDIILVQGDTTSVFAVSLAAFHNKIMLGHVEAGLRTGDKYNPFPEEINRSLTSVLADFHFSPTKMAKSNLLAEGVKEEKIFVTGNTVIDALLETLNKNREFYFNHDVLDRIDFQKDKIITVTTHRRESFGKPMDSIFHALKRIARKYANIHIIIPVHYNPNVRHHIFKVLGNSERIHLIEPLEYESFVHLMNKSYLMLTDSGGVQEEAPSLGKPVLVLRHTTERPEGLDAGTAKLVGTDVEKIFLSVSELLDHQEKYRDMANAVNPYGDGRAAYRIADILFNYFRKTKGISH